MPAGEGAYCAPGGPSHGLTSATGALAKTLTLGVTLVNGGTMNAVGQDGVVVLQVDEPLCQQAQTLAQSLFAQIAQR